MSVRAHQLVPPVGRRDRPTVRAQKPLANKLPCLAVSGEGGRRCSGRRRAFGKRSPGGDHVELVAMGLSRSRCSNLIASKSARDSRMRTRPIDSR